ncbi:MAG TPA: trypsin-like serine protease [Pseudobdellovibrionaceae bacterium]|nr:trypsin-like serine protease [Pseudobdellovibrionaceae bacterium]
MIQKLNLESHELHCQKNPNSINLNSKLYFKQIFFTLSFLTAFLFNSFSFAIVQGEIMNPDDLMAKSVVAILNIERPGLCSGTLLAGNLVKTAAHCLASDVSKMKILFGHNLNEKREVRKVDDISLNMMSIRLTIPDQKDTGDIALLHFSGSIPEGFEPAELLMDESNLNKGAIVYTAGYGMSDISAKEGSGILRKTSVIISDNQFALTEVTTSFTNGSGPCKGDSGGPAYVVIDGKPMVWGVVSRNAVDSEFCNVDMVYTNAIKYKEWIAHASSSLIAKANLNRKEMYAQK